MSWGSLAVSMNYPLSFETNLPADASSQILLTYHSRPQQLVCREGGTGHKEPKQLEPFVLSSLRGYVWQIP